MRIEVVSALALTLGCGGKATPTAHPTPVRIAPDYTATRWIPAHPTYAVAARSIREAQHAVADVFDSLGVVLDVDLRQVASGLADVLAVDPLSPDALTQIGIDVEGGIAVFSEGLDPTLVVHVSGPEQLASFFQRERVRGMKTESVMIGDVEVFTVPRARGLQLSWAVDADWLWVHFDLADRTRRGPDPSWFVASRHPEAPAWADDWRAAATGTPRLAGFVDVRGLLARLPKIGDAMACARLLETAGHFGFAIEGSDAHVAVRGSADLGPASALIGRLLLPPPEGWDAGSRGAPLAAQWNLDLPVAERAVAPCTALVGFDPTRFDGYGVRAARAMLTSFDPDDTSGTGAVAVDLASTRYVRSLLDQIPLRTRLESTRRFGPYEGRSLSIPFGPTVDYVLTDTMALAGVGEGMLARVVGRGPGHGTPALLAIDLAPARLSAEAWTYLFSAAHLPGHAVERLQAWRALHFGIRLEGSRLVIEASGDRR